MNNNGAKKAAKDDEEEDDDADDAEEGEEDDDQVEDDKDSASDEEKKPTAAADKKKSDTDGAKSKAGGGAADKSAVAKKTDSKTKNGKVEKSEDNDKDEDDDDEGDGLDENNEVAEDDENVVALAEIDRINENINKTRVDGLQVLHAVSIGLLHGVFQEQDLKYYLYFVRSYALVHRAKTMWSKRICARLLALSLPKTRRNSKRSTSPLRNWTTKLCVASVRFLYWIARVARMR